MKKIIIEKYCKEKDMHRIESILHETSYLKKFYDYAKYYPDFTFVATCNNQLLGFISFNAIRRIPQIILFTAEKYRRRGIGTKLLEHVESIFKDKARVEYSCFLHVDAEDIVFNSFLKSRGFRIVFSDYFMEREGGLLPKSDINVRNYEKDDYYDWHRIDEVASFNMRQNLGIYPSYYYPPYEEEKDEYFEDRDNRYVMTQNGKIVAIGLIGKYKLHDIAVCPEHQSKGYGRKFAAYLINEIITRGDGKVHLDVIKGNYAKMLYERLGFVEKSLNHVYQKNYRPDTRMKRPPEKLINQN